MCVYVCVVTGAISPACENTFFTVVGHSCVFRLWNAKKCRGVTLSESVRGPPTPIYTPWFITAAALPVHTRRVITFISIMTGEQLNLHGKSHRPVTKFARGSVDRPSTPIVCTCNKVSLAHTLPPPPSLPPMCTISEQQRQQGEEEEEKEEVGYIRKTLLKESQSAKEREREREREREMDERAAWRESVDRSG